MTRFTIALAAMTFLGAPVAAQTMTVLLPAITFSVTLSTSTKSCDSAPGMAPVCQIEE